MKNDLTGNYVASISPPPGQVSWRECIEWCRVTLGSAPTANLYKGRNWMYCGEGVFEFEQERDLTMFLLRWS